MWVAPSRREKTLTNAFVLTDGELFVAAVDGFLDAQTAD